MTESWTFVRYIPSFDKNAAGSIAGTSPNGTGLSVIDRPHRLAVVVGETVDSTKGAIRAIEETMAASEALREHLKQGERIGRKMVSALERGTPISEAVEAAGERPAELRQTSQDFLADYESCRHRMREFFMLASLDEGLSIGEVARKLGVSRQLASRLIREARESS
jgi:hypothetical protein